MAILKYEEKELCLPNYFNIVSDYNKYAYTFMFSVIGVFLSLFGLDSEYSGLWTFVLIVGIFAAVFGWMKMISMRKCLLNTDEMKNVWDSVVEKIRKRALSKLGVDDDALYANQQLVVSPKILNKGSNKLFFIKDKNDYIYSSLLDVHLLGVTKNYLSFYTASVNLQTAEIFNENTDEWFLEDIIAPSTRGFDISELESIGTVDVKSLPLCIKRPKDKNAFMVAVLKEPDSGWQKDITFKNWDLITSSTKIVSVKKSTGLDLFVIENKNGKQLTIQLLSEDFLGQMGANKSKEVDKTIAAIKTMIRNKRS